MRKIIILLNKYVALAKAIFYKNRFLNLLSIALFYIFHQTDVKRFPFLVEIEPTNRCNLKCSLCLTGAEMLKRTKGDMPLGGFKRIINQLKGSIVYLVLYFLGEPLLNLQIFQMIEYAKKHKIFIRLSSNFNFDNKQNITNIINCRVDELVISLDCATPQTYFAYKKNRDFERVIKNIKLLIQARREKLKPFINLQLLLMRHTENEISEFRKLVRSLNVDRGIIKKVRVDSLGIEPKRIFLPKNNKYIRSAYKNNSKESVCYRPWISTLFLWDGSVIPCCFDMEGEYNFGNISYLNFEQIWNNEKYIHFRSQMLKGSNQIPICKQCSFKNFYDNFNTI